MTIFVERRRPAFAPELLVRVGLAWAMIAALLVVTNLGEIAALRYPHPDDVLRLVQVRDLLAGQHWYDLTQHRIDAVHGGVALHWSRIVDLPLAGLILLLAPLVGQPTAEVAASVAVPLVTFGIALLLAGRIAWRVIGEEAAGLACLAMALSVPVLAQMRPLRIDHHGWEIVLALAAANGLMARSPRIGGWVTGSALALWLAISLEGLPMAAAFCGIAALRWLRCRRDAGWFVHTMLSLAVVSAGLFAAFRGLGDLAPYCDAVSPVHLAVFALGALGATGLAWLEPLPRPAVVGGLGVLAATGAGILLYAAPQCAAGTDAFVGGFSSDGIGERLPVWRQSPALALQILVPPVIAILAAIRLAGRSAEWLRRWWVDYALILAVALAVSIFIAPAGAVAGALAAVPLGWQLREWIRDARMLRRPGRRALALLAVAVALLPALPLMLFAFAMPAVAAAQARPVKASSCDVAGAAATLRELPPGEILAPFELGPALLHETGHSVVATGHRPGSEPARDAFAVFIATPAAALARLERRGTAYVALCPEQAEPARYARLAPDGLVARLREGHPPAWLEAVDVEGDGSFALWRIR